MTPLQLVFSLSLAVTGAPVELESSCPSADVDADEVRRVLSLELRPAAHDASDTRFVTKVKVDCEGSLARLTVDDPVSRKTLQRVVELDAVPPTARARMLGVAAAELVIAGWTELVTNPSPAVEPAAPAAPEATREQAADAVRESGALGRKSRLLIEATLVLPVGAPLLWGAGARWSWERFDTLGFELEARADVGSTSLPQGVVSVRRALLGAGVHARTTLGVSTWRALLVLRGGVTELSGTPAPGSVVHGSSGVGPWLGLALGGAASVQLGHFTAEVGLEAGVPLASVTAVVAGEEKVHLNGAWFGARVGLGLSP